MYILWQSLKVWSRTLSGSLSFEFFYTINGLSGQHTECRLSLFIYLFYFAIANTFCWAHKLNRPFVRLTGIMNFLNSAYESRLYFYWKKKCHQLCLLSLTVILRILEKLTWIKNNTQKKLIWPFSTKYSDIFFSLQMTSIPCLNILLLKNRKMSTWKNSRVKKRHGKWNKRQFSKLHCLTF